MLPLRWRERLIFTQHLTQPLAQSHAACADRWRRTPFQTIPHGFFNGSV